jgi:hypothetical protein
MTITAQALRDYEGRKINQICDLGFGRVGDAHNHCAHFVCHVLGIRGQRNCVAMVSGGRGRGVVMEVVELFTLCPDVGRWADRPSGLDPCLVFNTLVANVDLEHHRINYTHEPRRNRHVGIYSQGRIWHYKNTLDKVVTQTPDQFAHHYHGAGYGLFYGWIPRAPGGPARELDRSCTLR